MAYPEQETGEEYLERRLREEVELAEDDLTSTEKITAESLLTLLTESQDDPELLAELVVQGVITQEQLDEFLLRGTL